MVKKKKIRGDEKFYFNAFTFACKTFVMAIIGGDRKNYMWVNANVLQESFLGECNTFAREHKSIEI